MNRLFEEEDVTKAFFPVDKKQIWWEDSCNRPRKINGQYAIVDVEKMNTLSVVSDRYRIIENEKAFELAKIIVEIVFDDLTFEDFKCYNVYMSKSRGSCRIDMIVPHNQFDPFGYGDDYWTPFLGISNSYNRSLVLKYEIGFCRWICMNGVIFGQKGITISINHTEDIYEREIYHQIRKQKEVSAIDDLCREFRKKMQVLKETPYPVSMVLPMFCKVFNVKIDKELEDSQIEALAPKTEQIMRESRNYFAELGNNAYALMNVLTDYASYPTNMRGTSSWIPLYQRKVGNWIDDFVEKSKQRDFSLTEYIGKNAFAASFVLESLVHIN